MKNKDMTKNPTMPESIEIIGIGDFAAKIPVLCFEVGKRYDIVDEKKMEIVGSVLILEPPAYIKTEKTYLRRGDNPF